MYPKNQNLICNIIENILHKNNINNYKQYKTNNKSIYKVELMKNLYVKITIKNNILIETRTRGGESHHNIPISFLIENQPLKEINGCLRFRLKQDLTRIKKIKLIKNILEKY